MNKLSGLDLIAVILVVVGAINWGLVGAFGFNLVSAIFGDMSVLSKIIYILVGLCGIYLLVTLGKLGRK